MAIESSGSEENDLAVTGLTVGNLKSSSLPESAKSQPVLSSVSIKFQEFKKFKYLQVIIQTFPSEHFHIQWVA